MDQNSCYKTARVSMFYHSLLPATLYQGSKVPNTIVSDNKLYQQKLKPCCMLVITTQKVVTLFVLTGLIFLPIGITLLVQSTEVNLCTEQGTCFKFAAVS